MPLWALAIALSTGKNTILFGLLDHAERDTIFHLRVTARVQRARQPLSRRVIRVDSFTVRWQWTSCSSSFVWKVLGVNYNRTNNFYPVAEKIRHVQCTGQEVTFEPANNAHAHVDYHGR